MNTRKETLSKFFLGFRDITLLLSLLLTSCRGIVPVSETNASSDSSPAETLKPSEFEEFMLVGSILAGDFGIELGKVSLIPEVGFSVVLDFSAGIIYVLTPISVLSMVINPGLVQDIFEPPPNW